MEQLSVIVSRALADFAAAPDPAALENAKARYLGKAGELTAFQSSLKSTAPEQRRELGARFNAAKQEIEAALEARRRALADARLAAKLTEQALDVTLPGRGRGRGGLHPVIRTWQRIEEIWRSIGFDVADGPEIETDWFNFTALNSPENHPSRSMQDTFYVLCAHAQAPDQGHRARAHLPGRLRRHALADVSPGRGPVDRHQH
jgi:phenylalanyl-tRNA synthetase alpha chain